MVENMDAVSKWIEEMKRWFARKRREWLPEFHFRVRRHQSSDTALLCIRIGVMYRTPGQRKRRRHRPRDKLPTIYLNSAD